MRDSPKIKSAWQAEINALGKLQILIVDDDPIIVTLLQRVLADYELGGVHTAEDGSRALDLLSRQPIDLLLSDVRMPVMGGLELLKKIRCGEASVPRSLRTIFFTSTSPSDTLAPAINLDVNGFLPKPFTAESILQKILLAMADSEASILEAEAYADVVTDLGVLIKAPPSKADIPTQGGEPSRGHSSSLNGGQKLSVHQLKPGMQLADDVHTIEGMTLLKSGCVLDQRKVNRLRDLADVLASNDIGVA